LELYFIDVGQGDSVLIITPDRRHVLLDGGFNRKKQPHGKSGADFLDWKFFKDYGENEIVLDAMISSHNDADHYGGLWDLINPAVKDGLDTQNTVVRNFFHAGVSWWKDANNKRTLGRSEDGFLLDLMDDHESIVQALNNPGLKLQGEWAEFMDCITKCCTSIQRVGYNEGGAIDYLPAFGQDSDVQIKVLGPIVTQMSRV
jgi:hypothetical protein